MAASDTAGLIIAGGIGAGAAVVAQIISSVTTGRRDTKRFNWERERQEREWQIQEQERFLALKQEWYANFLQIVEQWLTTANRVLTEPGRYETIEELPKPRELGTLRSNIELVAPTEVSDEVKACYSATLEAIANLNPEDGGSEQHVEDAYRALFKLRRVLKGDLQGEREQVARTRQSPLAPSPSPEESRAWWQRALNKNRP